mgnify:CR=1 FL=1
MSTYRNQLNRPASRFFKCSDIFFEHLSSSNLPSSWLEPNPPLPTIKKKVLDSFRKSPYVYIPLEEKPRHLEGDPEG